MLCVARTADTFGSVVPASSISTCASHANTTNKRKLEAAPASYISAPLCGCGAGRCEVLTDAQGRIYFACPDEVRS
jgi:hypothetical protein